MGINMSTNAVTMSFLSAGVFTFNNPLTGTTGSGTNSAGGNLNLDGGAGTGTATPTNVIINTPIPGTSGSTAQTEVAREIVTGKTYSLTSGSATSVYDIAFANSTASAINGIVEFGIQASDSSNDIQGFSGLCPYSAVDSGGTVTAAPSSATALVSSANAVSTGTLSATCTVTTGTNLIHIQITATTSLSSPTITATPHLHQNSPGTVTVD